jgi:hypothetical protein
MSGLTMMYDLNNIKSYKGPPIQNLITGFTPMTASGTGYSFIGGTEDVVIPQLGLTTVKTSLIQNNYSAVSTWCCPNVFTYGNNLVASPSTLYTYGIVYKCDSGYTGPNYMYRYEYNGGTYVTESGVHSTSNRIHLGDGWYWAWGTFTTQATTNALNGLAAFYYQYSTAYDKLSIAKVFLAQGDHSALHPKYWPNVASTRASSQVLVDLTGINPLNIAGSPSYGSGKLTVPNVNTTYVEATAPAALRMGTQDFTISAWVKQLDNGTNCLLEARSSSNLAGYFFILNYPSTGQISFFLNYGGSQYVYSSSIATLGFGSVQNIVAVVRRSTSSILFYLNGVLWNTITGIHANSISPTAGDLYRIGYDQGGGTQNYEMYAHSHYNRALTALEVEQNFNALRGRYGI